MDFTHSLLPFKEESINTTKHARKSQKEIGRLIWSILSHSERFGSSQLEAGAGLK